MRQSHPEGGAAYPRASAPTSGDEVEAVEDSNAAEAASASAAPSQSATSFSNAPINGDLVSDVAAEVQGLRPVQAIQLGIRYQNDGNNDRAQAIYHHVLSTDPNNGEALHALAKLAHQVGDPELALTLISRAVYHEPNEGSYFRTMAKVLTSLGQIDAAQACTEKAMAIDPPPPPRRYVAVPMPRLASRRKRRELAWLMIIIAIMLFAGAVMFLRR